MTDRAFKVKNGLEFGAYAATIADTAVDVFVYDTSRDSDGGAWRHRTQHTSWYNETLNTATRGSRREFPAVAVIVVESSTVTIYDGDDPSLPMWMVFNPGGSGTNFNFVSTSSTREGCAALNGKLCVANGNNALLEVSFIDERAQQRYGSGMFFWLVGIVDRNATPLRLGGSDSANEIVNSTVNDVAMTVLPNAPIDAATGLPVPTIAVATDGGVSVIKDDGTVADLSEGNASSFIYFDSGLNLYRELGNFYEVAFYKYPVYLTNGASRTGYYFDDNSSPLATSSSASLTGVAQGNLQAVMGNSTGLYLSQNDDSPAANTPSSNTNALYTAITSSYNTGWMNGDIKLATLSDTDDTDVTGSELVTNGTFDTDTSGWTAAGSAVLSVSSNALRVTTSDGSFASATQSVTTVAGKVYVFQYTRVARTAGRFAVNVGPYATGQIIDTGTSSFTFVATSSSTQISLEVGSSSRDAGEYVEYDNISLRLAEPDRSVNGNGLAVYGTITKDPVATGADLVAYSGFSASNYLEQPYNSDLDFGTGDFCVMGWLKMAANTTTEVIFNRDSNPTAQRITLLVTSAGLLQFTCDDDTTARASISNVAIDNDVWTHFVALYDGAGDVKIYLNGALDDTETGSALLTLNNASAVARIGEGINSSFPLTNGKLALLRISATVPSDSQIAKIYEDEKFLFQENAQATLYGASDAVTALAHDEVTDLLHVGTSAGRSVFQGLRRVDNTTDAVGVAISAYDDLVVED